MSRKNGQETSVRGGCTPHRTTPNVRGAKTPQRTEPGQTWFNDVSASHPFYVAIAWAAANAITGGYADGGFRSLDDITRQAAIAFNERSDPFLL